MVGALILLVLPGALYNNYSNSNLVVSQGSFSLTCPGLPDTTCQGATATGCQVNAGVCTLSGNSISFLSGTSPFTALLTGNIGGLFSMLSAGAQATQHGAFDFWGGGANLFANCIVFNAANANMEITKLSFKECTQAHADGSNMTINEATTWTNWNTNFNPAAPVALQFFGLSGISGVYVMTCNNLGQFNYTQGLGGPTVGGYTWWGCDVNTGSGVGGCSSLVPPSVACLQNNFYNSLILAIPSNQGQYLLTGNGKYGCPEVSANDVCWHINVPVLLVQFEAATCFSTQGSNRAQFSYIVSAQCDQFYQTAKAQVGSTNNLAILGPISMIVGFFFGLALFFLGFGIQIGAGGSIVSTGTNFSLGSNPQGSKLAQVIGMGLIIWIFLFSEFSSWYTSGFLPYGLDGSFGVISIAITGAFWFGLYSWATSGSAGDD